MAWFTTTESYSTKEDFYGEVVINGGDDDDTSSTPPASGAWDDYQHEREYAYYCGGHSR